MLAANRRLPVLYVGRDDITAATQQALTDLDIDQTLVVGGSSAVSDNVLSKLPHALRVGGANAFATSSKVAKQAWMRDVPGNIAWVTDGSDRMETALLGAAVGRIGGLQLVSEGGVRGALRTIRRSPTFNDQVTRVMAVRRR